MSDKASAVLAKTSRPSGAAMGALAILIVAIVLASAATAPYVFKGATLEGEIAAQIRAATGLRVVSSQPARFSLLPSPHIEMKNLHLATPDQALVVEAGALDGDVRLLPLLVGRLELASATLTRPKLTIELDAGAMPTDSTIGRALHGVAAPGGTSERLGTVTLVDGTAVLEDRTGAKSLAPPSTKSLAKSLAKPLAKPLPKLDEINVTIDWPDVGSPATLTGSLLIDGTATDVAAWIAQPSSLMRGETSPIALRIRAAPLDLSANGDLVCADTAVFHGHLAVSAPSLPALLARAGDRARLIAPFSNIALNSDATITIDHSNGTTIDLPGLSLDLDGNHYEGTLAYQTGVRPYLSGTLATDTLTLAPFFSSEPSLADSQHRWTQAAVAADDDDLANLDLRVSATHLRAASVTIDDAALSVMTRGARTEVALNEGKAYGGALKGRASIGVAHGNLSLRGAGTLTDADLAGLSWDALGRQIATGTLSASGNIETSGDSPAGLMAHLQGWAKGSARDGEISGVDLGHSLRAIGSKQPDAAVAALQRGRTPFSRLAFAVRLADGIATLEDATITGPNASAALTGTVDIGSRSIDLDATVSHPQDAGKPGGPQISTAIKGSFDGVTFAPHVQTAKRNGGPPPPAR